MGLIRNHYVGRTFIEPQPSIRHFGVKVKLNPVRSILEGPAGRAGRRFDCARDDEPEDREDGARGGREGSARAHQLSADDLAVLLRRRHAAALGADRGDAYARGDPQYLEADSVAYLSLEGLLSAVGDQRSSYCSSCYTGPLSREFPRDEASYLQLALKLDTKLPVAK